MKLWGPVVAYMGIIFALSSRSTLPQPPAGLTYYHAHFIAYAGLAVVTLRATSRGFRETSWHAVLTAVTICWLYGASDEYHQSFVPGRTVDVLDWVADALGSIMGAGAMTAWSIIGRRPGTRDVL